MKKFLLRPLYLLPLLALYTAACSKSSEPSVCGDRIPQQQISSIPPKEQFEEIGTAAAAGLRWTAPDYTSICSSSSTRMEVIFEGGVDSAIARVEWIDGDIFRFRLSETSSGRWKGESAELPVKQTFDNNPASFGFSIDFYPQSSSALQWPESYDTLASEFDQLTLIPIARYQ